MIRIRFHSAGASGLIGKLVGTLFFLVFLAMGLVFTGLAGRAFLKVAGSYRWNRVDCEILSSSVREESQHSRDTPYSAMVQFAYVADGERRISETDSSDEKRFADFAEARRFADKYPTGAHRQCFVNPANPAEALLERRSLWFGLVVFFPMIFVAIGAIGMFALWRRNPADSEAMARPISSNADPNRGGFFPVVFFGVFAVMGLVFAYFLLVQPLMKILAARSWVPTDCAVISSGVGRHSGSKGGSTYSIDVLYQYRFKGKEYQSSRYKFMTTSSSGYDGKAAIVSQLAPGTRTTCYVNPSDPQEAVLERGFTADLLFGLIPLAFIVVGVGGFIFWRNKSSRLNARVPRIISTPLSAGRVAEAAANFPTPSIKPIELKPAMRPITQLFVMIFVMLFWNGIVSVFVYHCVDGWRRGHGEWFLTLFMIPFVLIGLGIIGAVIYFFLGLFNPAPTIIVSSDAVPVGGSIDLQWRFSGRTAALRRVRILLEGVEQARYRRGTSTSTDTSKFHFTEIVNHTLHSDMISGNARVNIPATVVHTFDAPNNKIIWRLRVQGDIPMWPDVNQEFPITVLPMPIPTPHA